MRNEKINRRGKGSGSRGAAPFIGLRVLTQDHHPLLALALCPSRTSDQPAKLFFSLFFFQLSSLFVSSTFCLCFHVLSSAYNIQTLPLSSPCAQCICTDQMFLSYYFSSFLPLCVASLLYCSSWQRCSLSFNHGDISISLCSDTLYSFIILFMLSPS